MTLTKSQDDAAGTFLQFLVHPTSNEMAIEGPPGTGKTFLVKQLIDLAVNHIQAINLITRGNDTLDIFLTATTNEAANALALEVKRDTKTIHSLLGIRPVFDFKTGKEKLVKTGGYTVVKNSLVIIDEASGISPVLLDMIRDSTHQCKVLYIGDRYQTTAVGETVCPVFETPKDADASYPSCVPIIASLSLKDSKRYDPNGPISIFAEQIRKTIDTGIFEPIVADGVVMKYVNGAEMKTLLDANFTAQYRDTNHAKIVTWSNRRSIKYSQYIRSLFTIDPLYEIGEIVVTNKPIVKRKSVIAHTQQRLKVTAVGNIQNIEGIDGYYVTLDGYIKAFQPLNQNSVKNKIDGLIRKKEYVQMYDAKEFYCDLRPLHASTTHKAQGSTFNTVFVDLTDIGKCHDPIDVARMLNVAITRASNHVYLRGELPKKYRG